MSSTPTRRVAFVSCLDYPKGSNGLSALLVGQWSVILAAQLGRQIRTTSVDPRKPAIDLMQAYLTSGSLEEATTERRVADLISLMEQLSPGCLEEYVRREVGAVGASLLPSSMADGLMFEQPDIICVDGVSDRELASYLRKNGFFVVGVLYTNKQREYIRAKQKYPWEIQDRKPDPQITMGPECHELVAGQEWIREVSDFVVEPGESVEQALAAVQMSWVRFSANVGRE